MKDRLGSGLVLFLGNEESPMNYQENAYPFRQDSSFLYYWGLDTSGLSAVLDVDEDEEIIFGTDPTLEDTIWTGPQRSLQDKCGDVGVLRSEPIARLVSAVGEAIHQGRKIRFLTPYRDAHRQRLETLTGIRADFVDRYASTELIRAVVDQRSTKSDAEIAQIEAALEISYEMHTLAMRLANPGRFEWEVAGAMEGAARSLGGSIAYPVIFSKRGEILHNHAHANQMTAGDIVVNDSGASAPTHYASDITRTIPISGRFTEQQKEICQIVLDAQTKAIREIRPGVRYKEIHLAVCHSIARGLKDLGLVKGDVVEVVAVGAHALFFPHGLGHMMGLDVHDMENLGEDFVGYGEEVQRSGQFGLGYLRMAKMLQSGFVVTVEPGLYLIPPLIDQWRSEGRFSEYIDYDQVERYKGFGGIRIEDDVVVTEDGCRLLGKPIPKTIDEVEAVASA